MSLGDESPVFKAKALAQSHPLTPLAKRYVDRAAAEQLDAQTLSEIGLWVSAALTCGYCLRRVEENEAGLELAAGEDADSREEGLEETVASVSADLRSDGRSWKRLEDEEKTIASLDRLIASELSNRTQNFRDQLDEGARAELEEYMTHWVVRGYALRAAELANGALA